MHTGDRVRAIALRSGFRRAGHAGAALITENFLINQSDSISCALKRVAGDQTHLLAVAGEQFSCVTPAVPSQSEDFTPK